jgi:hypothetical protein
MLTVKIITVNTVDEDARVQFDLNGLLYWAFCSPCDFKEHEVANIRLDFLSDEITEDEFWNGNPGEKKILVPNSRHPIWSYDAYGQIKSINPVVVDCGDIILRWGYSILGDPISDVSVVGKYIYFRISRLDIDRP